MSVIIRLIPRSTLQDTMRLSWKCLKAFLQVDMEHAIIHHYRPGLRSVEQNEAKRRLIMYQDGSVDKVLRYADFGTGVVLSSKLVES